MVVRVRDRSESRKKSWRSGWRRARESPKEGAGNLRGNEAGGGAGELHGKDATESVGMVVRDVTATLKRGRRRGVSEEE
jgi:hypothetical protein